MRGLDLSHKVMATTGKVLITFNSTVRPLITLEDVTIEALPGWLKVKAWTGEIALFPADSIYEVHWEPKQYDH